MDHAHPEGFYPFNEFIKGFLLRPSSGLINRRLACPVIGKLGLMADRLFRWMLATKWEGF